jgi:predicted RNase H-like nuclease (RuvC/YqgF family)
MAIAVTLEGDAEAKLLELAKRLNVPVEEAFSRALANGIFVLAETSAGRSLLIEDKRQGAQWRVSLK